MGSTETRDKNDFPNGTTNSVPATNELAASEQSAVPVDIGLDERSDIGMNEIFEILKNQRRQQVLRYLAAADGVVQLGAVAEHIAAWENDKPISQITSQERKRVYVGLYQCHLPKMDDMGAIKFNKPRGRIERGPAIDLFERYLPEENPDERTDEGGFWHVPVFSALLIPLILLIGLWTSDLLLGAGAALVLAGVATILFVRVRS